MSVVRLRPRTAMLLALASLVGALGFGWPLVVTADSTLGQTAGAPLLLAAILPLVLMVVVAELSDGRLDPKAVAMLGVLTALGAVLRPLGAGIAGIELVFFLLVLAGRVFGPGFGFVLGATTLFASALLTGGVGPWLPFQMTAAAWVGLGAGLLPPARGRREIAVLVGYGVVAALAYGFVMNLSFWPFVLGGDTAISHVPGAPVVENLQRFVLYSATTSLGWDIGRAVTNAAAIVLLGPAVLATLRRASRRAAFGTEVAFDRSPTSP